MSVRETALPHLWGELEGAWSRSVVRCFFENRVVRFKTGVFANANGSH